MLRTRVLWQIWSILGLTLIISTVLISLLVSDQVQRDAVRRVEQALLVQAMAMKTMIAAQLEKDGTVEPEEFSRFLPGITSRVTIIAENGEVLADNLKRPSEMDNHGDRPEIASLLDGSEDYGVASRYSDTLKLSMFYLVLPIVNESGKRGYLRLAVPLEIVDEQMRSLRMRLISGAALVGIIVLFVGYFLVLRVTIPISNMTAQSRNIAKGDYHLRVPEERKDELGALAKAINELASNVEQTIDEVTISRNRLAAVLTGLTEGVVAVDADLNFLHINQAALVILGMRENDTTGKKFDEVPAFKEVKQLVDTCISEQIDLDTTITEGAQIIECNCRWMDESGGDEVTGAIMVFEDITKSSRLEEIRSDFVANASHELKTPISAIRGLVETIIDDSKMSEEVFKRFMQRISAQTHRLDSIVQDLLQLSRFDSSIRQNVVTTVPLSSVMYRVHKSKLMDASDANVELTLNLANQRLKVNGETEALNQMVTNLVDNALKYSEEGGSVKMKMSQLGSMAQIEIIDDGIGISKDDCERIFERFYRVERARSRSMGGTGLGLAIVKHIAQAHMGSVSVNSHLGKGSTFIVQIPLADEVV